MLTISFTFDNSIASNHVRRREFNNVRTNLSFKVDRAKQYITFPRQYTPQQSTIANQRPNILPYQITRVIPHKRKRQFGVSWKAWENLQYLVRTIKMTYVLHNTLFVKLFLKLWHTQQGEEIQNTKEQYKMAYYLISRKANKTYYKIIYKYKYGFSFQTSNTIWQ